MDYLSGWCRSKRRLDGMTAVVTGCNTGIGKETARDFYSRGARVVMACRNTDAAKTTKTEIETAESGSNAGELVVEKLDLASLKSVREFANRMLAQESQINILVNNAGVMCCPKGKTEDGFETHMGTNHFGHALLTLLLLPKLIKSAPSRIVFVSSYLHKSGNFDFDDINYEKAPYDPLKAYCRSKAANVLFAKALAAKLKEQSITGVTVYSLHPGVIRTEIGRHFSETIWTGATWAFNNIMSWFSKSPRCGAQTTIYCAVDEACADQSGLYYSDCAVASPENLLNMLYTSSIARFCLDDDKIKKFWNVTTECLKLKDYDPFTSG